MTFHRLCIAVVPVSQSVNKKLIFRCIPLCGRLAAKAGIYSEWAAINVCSNIGQMGMLLIFAYTSITRLDRYRGHFSDNKHCCRVSLKINLNWLADQSWSFICSSQRFRLKTVGGGGGRVVEGLEENGK